MSAKISKLLQWSESKGITIDPRLSLVENPTTGDITVYNSSDEFILELQTREAALNLSVVLDIDSGTIHYYSGNHT